MNEVTIKCVTRFGRFTRIWEDQWKMLKKGFIIFNVQHNKVMCKLEDFFFFFFFFQPMELMDLVGVNLFSHSSWVNKGCVSHTVGLLAIYIKKYLKANEELWKLKYFTIAKNNIIFQKILYKKTKILQDIFITL